MAINPTSIASRSVTDQDVPLVIEMLGTQPNPSTAFSPARPAGQICGFYNGSTDLVELYVVSNSGLRFIRVG